MDFDSALILADDFLVIDEVEIETTSDTEAFELAEPSVPIKQTKDVPYFEANDYLNGALYDELNYSWSQTRTEIEIHVRLPEAMKSSKQISVSIMPTKITIAPKNTSEGPILEGILEEKFKHNEAMWTISPNGKLNISLDKQKEIWWKRLFQSENPIDVNKIDCTRPMDELPEDTQREIEKIQWDEEQKLNGKLTSAEIKQQEILKKAWDVEGSPFKGMPFDPTLVKFENSG